MTQLDTEVFSQLLDKKNIPWNKFGKFFNCLNCDNKFWVSPYHFGTAKYCSWKCSLKFTNIKLHPENQQKAREATRGRIPWNKGITGVTKSWNRGQKIDRNKYPSHKNTETYGVKAWKQI